MIIDKEIQDNLNQGVNKKNKNISLILVNIALTSLYEMTHYHKEQTILNQKINYYKSLQNKLLKL